jgi:hypothetical protein
MSVMAQDEPTHVSPEIITAADEHAASVNGAGATTPEITPADRPEVLLGAAFAGGFLLARIVRRIRG